MTTDFQEWLAAVELEGNEEVYSLYRAVKDASPFGLFDVKPARGDGHRWIVTASHVDQSLLIASSEARNSFLLHLTNTYCDRDLDMEAWHSYKHALSKSD